MNDLKSLLTETAAEAAPYDVTERAIRTVRRRRRFATAGPFAVAALVAAGLLVWLPLRPDGPAGGPAGPATASEVVGWLPAELAPAEEPPDLPDDRPVGAAVLAYVTGDDPATPRLLVEGGDHYRLDGVERVSGVSPDGRWVALVRDGRLSLRDMASATERDLDGGDEAYVDWSADSRWLVVRAHHYDRAVRTTTTVVEVATGRRTTLPVGPYRDAFLCGLRNAGDVVLCAGDEKSVRIRVWLVDGRTGATLRGVTVDPSAVLTRSERQADWAALDLGRGGFLAADDRTLLFRTSVYEGGLVVPADLIALDLDALGGADSPPAAPDRYALPETEQGPAYPNPDGSTNYGAGVSHTPAAVLGQGLLLTHTEPGADPARDEWVVGVELLALPSGEVRRATVVSGPIERVVFRGHRHLE